jgi:alcohol dehydrogenase class IV
MERVAAHLLVAVRNGEDLEARSEMLQGSLLTGAAMLQAGLGLMHAIGNVVGGLYHDLPHGLILLQCMDAVLTFNRPVIAQKHAEIEPLVDRIRRDVQALLVEVGVPKVELMRSELPLIAERACLNINAQTNPCLGTKEEVESLVRQSFKIC